MGSMAFIYTAAFTYVLPAIGIPKNKVVVNLGTFVGAICFFIAVLFLLTELTGNNEK